MEMLIVVAIIAVLIAIAIPVFGNQLEKAREAVDAANIRAGYAEVMADAILGDTGASVIVDQKQTKADWQTTFDWPHNLAFAGGNPQASSTGKWTLTWDATIDDNNGGVKATYSTS